MIVFKFVIQAQSDGKVEIGAYSDIEGGNAEETKVSNAISSVLQIALEEYINVNQKTATGMAYENPTDAVRKKIRDHFEKGTE